MALYAVRLALLEDALHERLRQEGPRVLQQLRPGEHPVAVRVELRVLAVHPLRHRGGEPVAAQALLGQRLPQREQVVQLRAPDHVADPDLAATGRVEEEEQVADGCSGGGGGGGGGGGEPMSGERATAGSCALSEGVESSLGLRTCAYIEGLEALAELG